MPIRIAAPIGAVAIGLLLLLSPALADEIYPTHPVRILAGSAAGGSPDVMARFLANGLSETLGNSQDQRRGPGALGAARDSCLVAEHGVQRAQELRDKRGRGNDGDNLLLGRHADEIEV